MDGFKSIKTYKIPTPDGHVLHVEDSGLEDGIPALYLHGGPGASIGQNYQWPFSPHPYRVIAFDQRGCGKSQPFSTLVDNNTDKLVEDIELIRQYFNIDKWLVFGGSWGSTLALVYAIRHPLHVQSLVLRGIFLGRQEDTEWFVSNKLGASQIFPNEYADFVGSYDTSDALTLCEEYYAALTNSDEQIRMNAARRWFNWESSISKLCQSAHPASLHANNQQVLTLALFECHYILNHCFLPSDYILDNAHVIQNIPTHIVHGRYDLVCKCEAAITLHKHLPASTLTIVPDAGHSINEKGIVLALNKALGLLCQE